VTEGFKKCVGARQGVDDTSDCSVKSVLKNVEKFFLWRSPYVYS
jgi:hypothetical protein